MSQDSRCPVGLQCVWEGDAAVDVTVAKAPGAEVSRVLHTSRRFEREIDYETLKIRLANVTPYPKDGVTIAPEDYRITLVVSKP